MSFFLILKIESLLYIQKVNFNFKGFLFFSFLRINLTVILECLAILLNFSLLVLVFEYKTHV
jgi:hypothetical protein